MNSATHISRPIIIRLLSFAKPYWGNVALALVCVFGSSAFVLAMPWLLKWGIDTGLTGGDKRLLWLIALGVIGSAALRGLFGYWQQFLAEWIAQRIAYDIRNAIYNHLQKLSFAYHDKAQTGQIMSRATQDVEGVRLFVSMGVLRLVYVAVLLVGTLIAVMLTGWQLALLSSASLPVTALLSIRFTMQLRPLWLKIQDQQGRMGMVLQE